MVSVLIVSWNVRRLLAECLASIPEGEYEALVADNASSDGSADMVRDRFPAVRLTALDHNTGYAAASNLLASQARGEWLLFLNPDTRLRADSVTPLLARMAERPRAALIAPQLISPDGGVQSSCRGFPEPWPVLAELLGLARLFPGAASYRMRGFGHDQPCEVDQPMATCWLVRREAWERVGPFDETFPIFFNDVDWCRRAKDAGWEIWFEPAAKVVHHGGASTCQVRRAMIWESHRSLLRYYRRHRRIAPPLYWLMAAAVWMGALLRAKGWHVGFRPDDHDR